MRVLAALLLIGFGACGRVGFELASDGAVSDSTMAIGHDEDGDGIPDTTDVCPHVTDDQADRDGDGVGDACDARPDEPGDAMALFVTFERDQPFSASTTGWFLADDALRYAGTGFLTLSHPTTSTPQQIWIGADVFARSGMPSQMSVGAHAGASTPHGYVEVFENNSFRYVAVSQFDGSTFMPLMMTNLATGLHSGRFVMRYEVELGAQTRHTIDAGWPNEPYTATAISVMSVPSVIEIDLRGLDIGIRYVAVIRSP